MEKLSNIYIGMKNSNSKNLSDGKAQKNGNQSVLPQNMVEKLLQQMQQQQQLIEQLQQQNKELAAKQKPNQKENEGQKSNEQPQKDPMQQAIDEVRQKDDEFQAINREQDERFRQQEQKFEKARTGRDILYYPKIAVSLDAFRRDEAAMVNNYQMKSSFADLFQNRLDQIPGERILLSVQPSVTIQTGLTEENRIFGPFDIMIPELDDKDEMYKVFMLVLLTNNFNLQSGQMITKLGAKVMTYEKQFLMRHHMMEVKLESHLLAKLGKIKSRGNNCCVPDFIWDQVKGRRGFKSYTYEKLVAEVWSFASVEVIGKLNPQLCTENIIMWAKECHPNVSIHAFDARYQKFVTHSGNCSNISLVFIVKDHHLFPITDEQLKTIATKANQGGAKNLLKYMIEFKWQRRNENVHKLASVTDVVGHKKEDCIMILPEEAKMQEAAKWYCDKSNFYIEYLHWNNNGILDGFMDEKNNMYLLNDQYDKREAICRKMFEMYRSDDFIWSNQSFTTLATSIFRQIRGQIKESCYNVRTRQILDDYSPRALQWCKPGDFPKNMVNFDVCKCYPSILLNNEFKIPVYDIHDTIVPFAGVHELDKIGEFYIDESVVKIHGNQVKIEAGFYNSFLVQFLVQEFSLPLSQIKWQITTRKYLDPGTFRKTIKFYFENFTELEAKTLANSFIGDLGRKYNKHNCGFTSTDYDTMMCCWTHAMAEGRNLTIDEYNGLFFVKETHCQRLFSDNTSVNRFVISGAVLQLLQLIQASVGENSQLVAYNTDGIFVTNPLVDFPHKRTVEFEIKSIGNAYMTSSKLSYFEKKYRENIDFGSYEVVKGRGEIVCGQAGSGKTTELCQKVADCVNPMVLSFTNKAIENVKKRLAKVENIKHDVNKICHTFDSFFCEWNADNFKELRKKTLFIEEYSMVPNKWMTMVYKAFDMYGIEVNMYGDANQCDPVDENSNLAYDYVKSVSVREMCPRIRTLCYEEKSCRYDKATNKMLNTFLKHGKVAAHFDPTGYYYKNICFLNATRKKVNQNCCDRFSMGKTCEAVMFTYNGGKELYKVSVGMPFIATTNLKDDGVFNMMEFNLEDMRRKSELEFKIAGKWYGIGVFANSFIPAFCVTVYKYQGADIDEAYNIHDVKYMDKKQLYTALSRTTKLEHIHLDNCDLNRRYHVRRQSEEEIAKSASDLKYNNGKIYKIVFSNGKIYVGSTCDDLKTRLKWHLADNKSAVHINSIFKPKIELIVKAPCYDKKTLEAIETKWIEWFAADYGSNLLNKRGNKSRRKSQRKTVVHEAAIETDKQLIQRVEELEGKIIIRDRPDIRCWLFDTVVDGKRRKTMARYNKVSKDEAFQRLSAKKQKLIKELTIDWQ